MTQPRNYYQVLHTQWDAPAEIINPPFRVLTRESANGGSAGENWVVGDWEPGMTSYFEGVGASVRDVIDLDLEDGFVELLRSFRDVKGGVRR